MKHLFILSCVLFAFSTPSFAEHKKGHKGHGKKAHHGEKKADAGHKEEAHKDVSHESAAPMEAVGGAAK